MKMNLVNIKNIEDITIGCELFHTKKNSIVKVVDILEGTVKLEGNIKYNSLATIRRWYKLVVSAEGDPSDLIQVDNISKDIEESAAAIDSTEVVSESPSNNTEKLPAKKGDVVKVDNTALRREIINACLDLNFIERLATRYNSFYLGKKNLLEVMAGKSRFTIYFNCTYLTDQDKELLNTINPNVRGNNGVVIVVNNDDKKRAIKLIKNIYYNFNNQEGSKNE